VASQQDLTLALNTFASSKFAKENSGWNYGINVAALIGVTDVAKEMVLQRANTPPALGYRWPGFAPHEQDFDPSADHFANMNRALQDMLLQSGDDGVTTTSLVVLPSWPCEWPVTFKLWGPLNTSVEVEYLGGGKVGNLMVTPSSRMSAVKWGGCVTV